MRTPGQPLASSYARRARGALGAAVLLLSAVAVLSTPGAALAARAHVFSFEFGEPGTGSKQLALRAGNAGVGGSGVAVNDATHDVYVADTENHRIDEFTSAGVFVRAWGWGVANGASELQVCTSTCQQGLEGSKPGEFEVPTYIAVDNSQSGSQGDVYVGDTGDNLITKFNAEGKLASTWGNNENNKPNGQLSGSPTEGFGKGLRGIAVDGAGTLWVFDVGSEILQFNEAGTMTVKCKASLAASEGVGGIAVSTSGNSLYIMNGFGFVEQVEPGCANPEFITSGSQEARGIAIDGSDGDVYVDREGVLVEDISASCVPSPAGCAASQVFGEEALSDAAGLAVDPGSGAVYVANAGAGLEAARQDQIVAYKVAVEASTLAADEVHAHAAVLHGTVNPLGRELVSCRFEYGETENYEASVPCAESPAEIGSGTGSVTVHAEITALDGGKTYHFRLHAVNSAAGVYGDDKTLETRATAQVSEVTVSEITGSSALLSAHVNPRSSEGAHYHFEYGACTTAGECPTSPYGTNVPVPDATVAAGAGDVVVSQHIEGLTAGATYHFRIAVEDGDGLATPQREGTFVFEPALAACGMSRPALDDVLADCRAYELVTPPDKNGGLIDNGVFLNPPVLARDGSRVLGSTLQCFHAPPSCVGIRQAEGSTYSFGRTEAGWAAESLAPPASVGSTMLAENADTGSVLYAVAPSATAPEEFDVREPDGALRPIGPIAEPPISGVAEVYTYGPVVTSDLSRVVYQSGTNLWPSLEGGAHGLQTYEYAGAGQSQPVLVGVTGPAGSKSLISACGTFRGAGQSPRSHYNTLAADGRTVWFTAAACPGGGTGANVGVKVSADALYERVEQEHGMETVLASGSAPEPDCDAACQAQPPGDAAYQGAASDGSRVFFTDTRQLTDNASEDRHAGDSATSGCDQTASTSSGCNLYEFVCPNHCEHISERRLVDVSAGDSSGLGPRVQDVLAIPPDGSDVYFIARGVLTERANKGDQEPVPGGDNLYVYREGHTSFIATLSSSDSPEWLEDSGIGVANVTSDGRFLVFTSHRGLTPDATSGEGPAQVYRYDAETEQLARVSVGDQGFNDNGNASVADARIVEADDEFITGDGPGHSDPTMSENGAFVFFESPTGLTPGALNDQHVTGNPAVLAENVYEWAADGSRLSENAPVCAQPGGCVSLISDGRDLNEGSAQHFNTSAVELLGTDETGSNVFFWTADQLVGQDTDSQVDLYDARVNGGFTEPTPPPECEPGETLANGACRGTGSTPPPPTTLASAVFTGAGNLTAAPFKPPPTIIKKTAAQLKAEQLAKALALCHRDKQKSKRAKCEKQAKQRYGPVKAKKGKTKTKAKKG
jgi:DNA-binding beta-propeller fold protein YncE